MADIIDALRQTSSIYCQCQLWGIIFNREGANYEVNGETVINALKSLYYRAGTLRYWRAVRYCSSLLHHTVDSISPFITTVLVNGKQVRYKLNFHSFFWMFIENQTLFSASVDRWCDWPKRNRI